MPNNASILSQWAQRPVIQPVNWSSAKRANCRIWVKRDDLIHPQVSGNKLFKLFHYVRQASALKSAGLISFGGAYSNHLYALARVASTINLPCVGIIRGEENTLQNPTLAELTHCGMQLECVGRAEYRQKMDAQFSAQLQEKYPGFYVIPEGGAGVLGARGFADYAEAVSAQLINENLNIHSVWLPAGTGTSVAGLAAHWPNIQAVCALALSEPQPYIQAVAAWTHELQKTATHLNAHPVVWHGFNIPFGKLPQAIMECCWAFWCETGLLFDPIYGSKVLFALQRAFEQGLRDQNILILHTGGIQGWRGFFTGKHSIPNEFEHAVAHYLTQTQPFILNDIDLKSVAEIRHP
ncbi:MAG: hypothetical protein RL497_1296 [Pseudomonadota bacterium]|jgi:1-aminocyclopropane-1-carboxylate deaminase